MSARVRGAALVVAGGLLLGIGAWMSGALKTNPWVVRWFGPPRTVLVEAYADARGTARFDHTDLDAVLKRYVIGHRVDYEGLAADRDALDRYIARLADAPFDALDRDGRLALLINAYNAFTLALILDHRPLSSIRDIPAAERWDAERWVLGGRTLSLTAIEHEELRAKFVEPRLHFAINCASEGCPPLRAEAYTPERLEVQLEAAARTVHDDLRWLRVEGRTVHLTPLYLWYAGDFEQVAGSVLGFASRYRPELATGPWTVAWMDYDWSLNDVAR